MKRIAITQRVDIIPSYQERRDALDQAWYDFLLSLDCLPLPLPNLPQQYLPALMDNLPIDGIIFSGGNSLSVMETNAPDQAPERDQLETTLLDYAIHQQIPVLGVCRGMQLINVHLGGRLRKVDNHIGARHPLYAPDGSLVDHAANSFHQWGIDPYELAPQLQSLAVDANGAVEAFYGRDATLLGIMWHPEREQPFRQTDSKLIKQFFYEHRIDFGSRAGYAPAPADQP